MLRPERKRRQVRMRNKWIKRFFPIFALLLLTPWPIAYAHSYDGDMAGQDAVQIEVADPSAAPNFGDVFGRTIGGVTTPGDLFYIDATENAADIQATLHICLLYTSPSPRD